jgi:hypothetical protein
VLDVYRLLANRIGTGDADELGHDLRQWHDAMVRHERSLAVTGQRCPGVDECPHVDATELWKRARKIFGEHAETLTYLRASAEGAASRDRGGVEAQ